MHGWSRTRKRLLLAVMLLPGPLIVGFTLAVGVMFARDAPGEPAFGVALGLWLGAFGAAYGSGVACVVDAVRGRVGAAHRGGWVAALLLGATVAAPAYWWLHVRPGPGEPHGLETLAPARAWPGWLKAATGAGSAFMLLFMVAWMAFVAALAFDGAASAPLPLFAACGVWTVVACAILGLFFLDALREGGTHAALWGILLVLAWMVAAPLYWLLFVRPTARPDGGP